MIRFPSFVLITLLLLLRCSAAVAESETWHVVTDDGVTLHGESFGATDPGAPVIVFVHGGPSFPPLQTPAWLAALGSSSRVHLYHQRGAGRSTRVIDTLPDDEAAARRAVRTTYGIDRHLRDLDAVIDARAPRTPIALVGHSFGGFIATLYAAAHGDRLSTLTLLAPADVLDGALTDKPVFDTIARALPDAERPAFRTAMAEFLTPTALAGRTDAALAARTDQFGWYFMTAMGIEMPKPGTYPPMRWAGGAAVAGVFLDLAARGDQRAVAARITVPTLILHGSRDVSPVTAAQSYAESIPGAHLMTCPGERHFFDHDPAEVAASIRAHLTVLPLPMPTPAARERFIECWTRLDLAGADDVWTQLVAHYGAPGRHYHTLDHITSSIGVLDTLRDGAANPDVLELAIWFHDVIYDTPDADGNLPSLDSNERRSAAFATTLITERGGPVALAERVRELIEATEHGTVPAPRGDVALLLDIDLAILGADRATFAAYDAAIRREYAIIADDVWRDGRRSVLAYFDALDPIYHSPRCRARYEAAAHRNLKAAIAALDAGGA